jgi:hypothetical protein
VRDGGRESIQLAEGTGFSLREEILDGTVRGDVRHVLYAGGT